MGVCDHLLIMGYTLDSNEINQVYSSYGSQFPLYLRGGVGRLIFSGLESHEYFRNLNQVYLAN